MRALVRTLQIVKNGPPTGSKKSPKKGPSWEDTFEVVRPLTLHFPDGVSIHFQFTFTSLNEVNYDVTTLEC